MPVANHVAAERATFPDDDHVTVGGERFQLVTDISQLFKLKDENGLVVGKSRRGIERYLERFAGEAVANVVELGIFRGGSVAFFDRLFAPRRLAAIDIQEPVTVLEDWIARSGAGERVRTFYGTDQADVSRLHSICDEVFGTEPLDVVLDDASHQLDPTRASFNALFPRLRPGGSYVIEDWAVRECFRGWEELLTPELRDAKPVSELIFQIVIASARSNAVVEEVVTHDSFVLVRRGPADLSGPFDIRDHA